MVAGRADAPSRMIGDINFFLYPWDDGDDGTQPEGPRWCAGEVDVMIAEAGERGKGLGRAAVSALLCYIRRNLERILAEYDDARGDENRRAGSTRAPRLRLFMAKIKETNAASLALFKSLGFRQQGSVDYFGEVKLVLEDYEGLASKAPEGYAEVTYVRPEA